MMNNPSGTISSAPVRNCESVVKAGSSSLSLLACTIWMSLASARAASCTSFALIAAAGFFGLINAAKTSARGVISRSSSSPFPITAELSVATPVRLPPGRLKLGTRPRLTGSSPR